MLHYCYLCMCIDNCISFYFFYPFLSDSFISFYFLLMMKLFLQVPSPVNQVPSPVNQIPSSVNQVPSSGNTKTSASTTFLPLISQQLPRPVSAQFISSKPVFSTEAAFSPKPVLLASQQSAVGENVQLGAILPALSGLRPLKNLTVSITKGKDFFI